MIKTQEIVNFISSLKDELKTFHSFPAILKKADQDGYLQCIHVTLDHIFQNEIKFAIESCVIRTQQNSTRRTTDDHPSSRQIQSINFQREHETDF